MTASPQTQTERAAPALEPMLISIADGKKLIGNPCLDTIYKLIGSGEMKPAKRAAERCWSCHRSSATPLRFLPRRSRSTLRAGVMRNEVAHRNGGAPDRR